MQMRGFGGTNSSASRSPVMAVTEGRRRGPGSLPRGLGRRGGARALSPLTARGERVQPRLRDPLRSAPRSRAERRRRPERCATAPRRPSERDDQRHSRAPGRTFPRTQPRCAAIPSPHPTPPSPPHLPLQNSLKIITDKSHLNFSCRDGA